MNVDNINRINSLYSEKANLEEELENVKDEISKIRKDCKHIPVKVSNLQIDNITYCLFCGRRVTRQRDYFIDAHSYKIEKYGDGFIDKERQGRLRDLQNVALNLYEEKGNLTNEEVSRELKKFIQESNDQANKDKVIKKVIGKWVDLWMSKR